MEKLKYAKTDTKNKGMQIKRKTTYPCCQNKLSLISLHNLSIIWIRCERKIRMYHNGLTDSLQDLAVNQIFNDLSPD